MNAHQAASSFGPAGSAASGDPPWIGIHVLSEFVFCPRAGVLTFELGHEDTGEERDRVPPLDYLPDFELELIEERLQQEWQNVGRLLLGGIAALLVCWVFGVLVRGVFLLMLLAGAGWWLGQLVKHGKAIFTLVLRRNEALKAVPEIPDPDLETLQPVHWWNLLKAGFTPVEYAGPHRDAATRLLGRPWRVLEKGSLRIPVFRKLRGAAELYPQHFVRMAAYCHVIEQSEGGHSPYGIILFGYGYTGCTVPNIAVHRHAFGEALEKAKMLIDAAHKENQSVDVPPSLAICKGCPHGEPREHVPGETEIKLNGQLHTANTRKGSDGKPNHSPCGDCFEWVPPHELAVLRGLR